MTRLALVLVASLAVTGVALAGTTLKVSADAKNGLRFDKSFLKAKAGSVTITMTNPSVLPHNVAVKGNGVNKLGKVVGKGGTSTVTAKLRPGRYTFFCSVPGHEKGGMKGTLVVG